MLLSASLTPSTPAESTLLANHAALALPCAELLVTGGDSRLCIDARTGRNKYGCSPIPKDDLIPFGSCTASSISTLGFAAAAKAQQWLRAVGPGVALPLALEDAYENIRRELWALLTLGRVPGVEIVLTPSGTDAELIALALANGDGAQPVRNIVVGPTEVGSGTVLAAGGRYFDALTPNGAGEYRPGPGVPVDEHLAANTCVERVWLRDTHGHTRVEDELDAEVKERVAQAIGDGERVLLHLVAHSKTGVHAPSLNTVATLRSHYGERLTVVIDAAQGRFSRRGLIEVLQRGYLMLITGSKFYGGPPFAGALLVPENLHPHRRGLARLPRGFGDFFTAGQLPQAWATLRAALPPVGNPGLVLRWLAALAKMRDYYAAPSLIRLEVLRAFERLVPEVLSGSPLIRLQPVSPPLLSDNETRLLESKTTVFPFALTTPSPRPRELNRAELGRVFHWLYQDASALPPHAEARERRALAAKLHLGQPVALGRTDSTTPAVLRVALGGALLVKVSVDLACGATLEQRIDWLAEQLRALKNKLELLGTHYDALAARELS